MVLASKLLQTEGIDFISRNILKFCVFLDENGAWEWSHRVIALVAVAIFYSIRFVFDKKKGVDWYALTHGIVSAAGSIAVVYLNIFASEALTGTAEPLRSLQCQGPLTSLHKVMPAITLGYSFLDLMDGMTISVDFLLHGLGTLTVMGYFCETGNPHLVAPLLLMEGSTPFLTIVRAEFFSQTAAAINLVCFATAFFICRIVIVPYLWFNLMMTMYAVRNTTEYQECFSRLLFPIGLVFGVFFNCLNGYWFIKIVKKAQRKIQGIEKLHANNDLYQQEMKEALQNGNSEQKPHIIKSNGKKMK